MASEQDLRTPISQSEELFAALKTLGVPVRMLRFDDPTHGTDARPSNYMRSILYLLDWYDGHSLDGDDAIEARQ
jgi:dipeptidyl aminopeptidase/acylaminoacyl peptidase